MNDLQNCVIGSIRVMLNSFILDNVVAGGYPRDLAHGKQPKDVDVCIYNFHPGDYAEMHLVEGLQKSLKKCLDNPDTSIKCLGDELLSVTPYGRIFVGNMSSDDPYYDTKNIAGVLKLVFKDSLPMDLIFREDCHHSGGHGMYARFNKGKPCNSVHHVMADFDVNLSQYIIDPDTNQPVFMGKDEGTVHIVNSGNLTKARACHLANKAIALDWSYVELQAYIDCDSPFPAPPASLNEVHDDNIPC